MDYKPSKHAHLAFISIISEKVFVVHNFSIIIYYTLWL